ncbi:MAG: hypothetical protein M1522_07115, partial [Actinobacteria bacterium]|nr:hypothetical protein [Actinomycetota bacterium]
YEEEEGDGTEQAPPASSLLPPPAPAKEPSKAVAADAVVARPRRSAKRTAPVKKRSAPKPKPQRSLPAETGEGGEQSGTLPFTIRLEQHELQRLIGYAVAHGEESVAECARHLLLSSVAAEEMTPDALLARIRSDLASLEDAFAKGAGLDVPKIVRVIVSSE